MLPQTKKISSSFSLRSRLAGSRCERELHEVCGLVVQAVGHVEIGLGDRVGLVKVDRGLRVDRVVEARLGTRRGVTGPASG